MNRLSAILPAGQVLVDVDASSKKRVFEHAGLLFENQHSIARATVTDNLFARERLGSTGLGQGVAVPHGRIDGLRRAIAIYVRPLNPIPFDAPDGKPVTDIVALLVPAAAEDLHLRLLADVAQRFCDRRFRQSLHGCADRQGICDLFAGYAPPTPE